MTLEQQVCSLELSKKLKELGVKQESYFRHVRLSNKPDSTEDWYLLDRKPTDCLEIISAFTVAELGEMLPDDYVSGQIPLDAVEGKWKCMKMSFPEFEPWNDFWEHADTEADARSKMLIYLIENNLVQL